MYHSNQWLYHLQVLGKWYGRGWRRRKVRHISLGFRKELAWALSEFPSKKRHVLEKDQLSRSCQQTNLWWGIEYKMNIKGLRALELSAFEGAGPPRKRGGGVASVSLMLLWKFDCFPLFSKCEASLLVNISIVPSDLFQNYPLTWMIMFPFPKKKSWEPLINSEKITTN